MDSRHSRAQLAGRSRNARKIVQALKQLVPHGKIALLDSPSARLAGINRAAAASDSQAFPVVAARPRVIAKSKFSKLSLPSFPFGPICT